MSLPRLSYGRSGVTTAMGIRRLIPNSLTTMFLCSLGKSVRRTSEQGHVHLLSISVGPPYAIFYLYGIVSQRFLRVYVHRSNGYQRGRRIPRRLRLQFLRKDHRRNFRVLRFRITTLPFKRFKVRTTVEITTRYALTRHPRHRLLRTMRVLVRNLKLRIATNARRRLRIIVRCPIGTSRYRVLRALLFLSRDKGILMKARVKIMYFLCTICPSAFLRLFIVFARGNRRNGQFLPSALSHILSRLHHSRTWTILCPIMVPNGLPYRIVCNAIRNGKVLTSPINAPFFEVPSNQVSQGLHSCLYEFNVCTRLTRRLTRPILTSFHTISVRRCNGYTTPFSVLFFDVLFRGSYFFGKLSGSSKRTFQCLPIRGPYVSVCLIVNRFHMGLYDLGLTIPRRLTSHFGESSIQRHGFHNMNVPSNVGSRQAISITGLNGLFRMRVRIKIAVRQ